MNQLLLALRLCLTSTVYLLSDLVAVSPLGSNVAVVICKNFLPLLATLSSLAIPSLPSTTPPMTQSGSRPCLRPPSLLLQPPCHQPRPLFLLQRPLTCLRSLLWSRPTRTVHHRFHRRTCHIPMDGCFSNVFGSSTLKLLLVVCLILLLRAPPSHRLLCRPTLLLPKVFSPGPGLRRPPLSSAPTPPWVAPSSLLIGSAAPRTATLRPVSRPPLLPLDLASLHGAVALPDKSSASSIPPTILLENSWTRRLPLLLVAGRAVLVRNLAPLPACRLAGVRAVLDLKTDNFSNFNSGDQNPFSPHSIHFFLFNPLYAPCSPVRPEPRPLLFQP
jgi:hypothetical protein